MTTASRTSRSTNGLRTRIEWLAARLFVRCVRSMSPRKAASAARVLGTVGWVLFRSRKQVAIENLRSVFPDRNSSDRTQIGRSSFQSFALTVVEAVRLPELPPAVTWTEPDAFEPFIREGRPAVILGGHLGNWEVAAWAIARRGGRLDLVVAAPHNPLVARFAEEHRRKWGVVPHDRERSLKPLFAALRRGRLVGTAADQWPGSVARPLRDSAVTVPFLGRDTPFGTGMVRLALRTGVPVLAIGAIRGGKLGGRFPHRFEIQTELIWDGTPPAPDDEQIIRHWAAWLETAVRAHPEQYLWLHRRWKAANSPEVSS